MSIRTKVICSFGIIFAIVSGVFAIQLISSNHELNKIRRIEEQTLRSALLADDIKLTVIQVLRHLTNVGATRKIESFEEAEKFKEQFERNMDQFAELNPELQEEIDAIRTSFAAYYELGNQMAQDYLHRGIQAGNATMFSFNQVAADINDKVDKLREEQLQDISQSITGIRELDRSRNISLLWSVIVIALIGCLTVFMFLRSLLVPIRRLIHTSSVIAAGDLSQPLTYDKKDEFAALTESFEKMRLNLARLIGDVQNASLQVAASAEQLAETADENARTTNRMTQTAHHIAKGAEQQSYNISEASRAMEEMAGDIQRIAELTGRTSALSIDAEQQANQGFERIERAMQQMRSISRAVHETADTVALLEQHSSIISDIIASIAEIAQMTNLLALNESIEAARAGEHGKGFAVVAHEIRKLAGRTKDSSEQIAEILSRITLDTQQAVAGMNAGAAEVENGMIAIDDAGASFEEIMKANVSIAGQLREIRDATENLSAGSQQIAASVSELSTIAEKSSEQIGQVAESMKDQLASMEEISGSTRLLRSLAEQLEADTERFKV